MLHLLKYLDGPWEAVREYLHTDLDHIESAINTRWGAIFNLDENTLQAGVIGGDPTPATRYVANTGVANAPTWDQVDLSNGVTSRLPFLHLVAATNASRLVGRQSGSAGDFGEITVGEGLQMDGSALTAPGRYARAFLLMGG
jgi:hypothetical protein